MPRYIALIHKQTDSCYGVSFPDVPGVFTAGDTIDEAIQKAVEVLEFAAQEAATGAVVAAVPFKAKAEAAE